MKKLMYSATRVIRQELATVYRSKFGIFDGRYASDGSISGLIPQSLPAFNFEHRTIVGLDHS